MRRQPLMVFGLVAAALLALLTVFAVELIDSQSNARKDVESRFRDRARASAALTESLFSSASATAQTENVKRYGAAHVSSRTLGVRARQAHNTYLVLLSKDGKVISASPGTPAGVKRMLEAKPDYISNALRGQLFTVSNVQQAGGASSMVFTQSFKTAFGRRLIVSGLSAKPISQFLGGYLKQIPNVEGGRAYVLDQNGKIVASPEKGTSPGEIVQEPGLVAALANRPQGNFEGGRYRVSDGVRGTPWRVVLTAPSHKLFASVSGARKWVPWILFTAFGLAAAVALLLLRQSIRYAIRHDLTVTELNESRERFTKAFNDAATGMAVTSAAQNDLGRFLEVNDSLCEMTGYSEEELLEKRFADLTHPDDLPQDLEGASRLIAGVIQKYQTEKRYIRSDGSEVWILMTASLVRDANHQPVYFLSQMLDITERRRAEKLKDEFFALVSHELRTPLTSMVGYLELLTHDTGDEAERQRCIEVSLRNTRRLNRLVDDLLFMAQLESGALPLKIGEVDLSDIVSEAVEAATPRAKDRGLDLKVTHDPELACWGDRDRLAQAIDNLISNALKFTPPGGTIAVNAGRDNGRVRLEVSDTGLGIPAGEQAKLFQRFFRGESASAEAIPGIGLGLTITKAIVEGHGGQISVESEEGRGTSFRIDLPVQVDSHARNGQRAAVTS